MGQFGSGHIDVFSPDGHFGGFLHDDVTGSRITIDGLWALRFGNGASAGPNDTLFLTAGTAAESAGLFGSLTGSKPPTIGDHDHEHDRRDHDDGNTSNNVDPQDHADDASALIGDVLRH